MAMPNSRLLDLAARLSTDYMWGFRGLFTDRQAKRINAIMRTCGFCDGAGKFAFEVRLPGKSGVGGHSYAAAKSVRHRNVVAWPE